METRYVANTVVLHRQTGEVLVTTRARSDRFRAGEFDLPGGKVDAGETIHEGAARKLLEEAGIQCTPQDLVLVWADTEVVRHHSGQDVNWLDLMFVLVVDDRTVVLSGEHSAYQWTSMNDVHLKLGHDPHIRAWKHLEDYQILDAILAGHGREAVHSGAKLLLYGDTGEVLILRRSDTHPRSPLADDLPGGIVEYAERPDVAVQRELTEETGLTIIPGSLRLAYAYTDTALLLNEQYCWTVLLYVACVAGTPTPQLSYEHSGFWWRPLSPGAIDLPNTRWQTSVDYLVSHGLGI